MLILKDKKGNIIGEITEKDEVKLIDSKFKETVKDGESNKTENTPK